MKYSRYLKLADYLENGLNREIQGDLTFSKFEMVGEQWLSVRKPSTMNQWFKIDNLLKTIGEIDVSIKYAVRTC